MLQDRIWRPTAQFQLTVCGYTPMTENRAGRTVFGYWTDDFRFAATWAKPKLMLDKILAANLLAIVEPDHSVYDDDPLIEQMHAIYRARWTARFWQEHGISVIPNITWSTPESLDWSLCGIPDRPPIVAIEGRPRQRRDGLWQEVAREACRRLQPKCVLLYGATAEMAAAIPGKVIAFTSASPRSHVPVRMQLNRSG